MNATIACFSTGTLGPLYYSLSMRVHSFPLSFPFQLLMLILRRTLSLSSRSPTSSLAAYPPTSPFSVRALECGR